MSVLYIDYDTNHINITLSMNHKKIKKQIKKVNSFFESIADEEISKIERDLLLSYVRKLYESILDDEPSKGIKSSTTSKETVVKAVPNKTETSQPVAEEPEKIKAEVVETPRKPFERANASSHSEIDVDATTLSQEDESLDNPKESVSPLAVKSNVAELSENMASIFHKTEGTEISDRLSSLPLKDLTKSMGINEMMFTIKELFGGNQERFKTVMSDLNKLGGYDEAKAYLLEGVATELEWDSEANYKKADKFVKLVQRRFS